MSILITGGSKGIGRAIAEAFAGPDRTVLINFRSDEAAAQAALQAVTAQGAHGFLIQGDAGTPAGCAEIAGRAADLVDSLDILVHCAVDAYASAALEADAERFARAAVTNGASILFLVQACLPILHRGSSVFFLSSRGSKVVVPRYAAIGAGKAMSECLVRYLATELAPRGIRINCLSPGIVETEAVRTLFGDQAPELVEHAAQSNPSGRGVQPQDYTALMRFLASDEAAYITGQTIAINGGANLMP
ncbi:MAG: SDR family oxidoreductase [Rhodothalassiaceae bacterium]